jgi:SpoVK/Ycf46/Vps4 family AAA+-type ATPase
MLELNLKGIQVAENVSLADLSKRIEGYSGADIANVRLL